MNQVANDEIRRLGKLIIGPNDYIVIDRHRVSFESFITQTTFEQREHMLFRRRDAWQGDGRILVDDVGPRKDNESRQVYRARIRAIAKKHDRCS